MPKGNDAYGDWRKYEKHIKDADYTAGDEIFEDEEPEPNAVLDALEKIEQYWDYLLGNK